MTSHKYFSKSQINRMKFWIFLVVLPDARDGVFIQIGSVGCKLRPRLLLLLSESNTVPLVGQRGAPSLPELEECDG